MLTIARHMRTANPSRVKCATNAERENITSRSSSEWAHSGTMSNIAMRTAPPAMRRVPRMKQAMNVFHRRETAPSGARMTTGSEPIWNSEPRTLEERKITEE
jgi:hypothetical protein